MRKPHWALVRRHRRLYKGFRNAAVAVGAVGAIALIAVGFGLSSSNKEALQLAEQTRNRNAFFESLSSGGLNGEGSTNELSRAVSDLLATPASTASSNPLTPDSLDKVYAAPGMFDGVSEKLGYQVFADANRDSERSSETRSDYGHFSKDFLLDAKSAYEGDLDTIISEVPQVHTYNVKNSLLLSLLVIFSVTQVIGWLVGILTSRESYYEQPKMKVTLEGLSRWRKAVLWGVGFPAMLLWKLSSTPSEVRIKIKDRKDAAQQRRKRKAAAAKAAETAAAAASSPVVSELKRVRENIKKLGELPQIPEVVEALTTAKEAEKVLSGMPQTLTESTAVSFARSVQQESEDLISLSRSITKSHNELNGRH